MFIRKIIFLLFFSLQIFPAELTICTYNIQFLGHFKKKENELIANFLKDFDIVVVQELVAPPFDGNYPDGSTFFQDDESFAFFNSMIKNGFDYIISPEDTSPKINHVNSSASEYFVAFYKKDVVIFDDTLPNGFISEPLVNHEIFDRVPFAFSFKSIDNTCDFVLISVHLAAGFKPEDTLKRQNQFNYIVDWIKDNSLIEKDFIILGDFNIYSLNEYESLNKDGFDSLNDECLSTNTLVEKGRPYDHIFFNKNYTSEIDLVFNCKIIDTVAEFKNVWNKPEIYPGEPYNHNKFKQHFSDHNPIIFKISSDFDDD